MGARILIADSDADRGKSIAEACAARGIDCSLRSHGAAALETALSEVPAVLIVQLELPLIDGEKLGEILRANPRTRGLAILLLADRIGEAAGRDLEGELFPAPVDIDTVADAAARLAMEYEAEQEEAPALDEGEAGGVEGHLAQLSLGDLLQLFHVSRKTGEVELERSEGDDRRSLGRVLLRGGDVVHAVVEAVEGEKALYRLLGWRRGSFTFRPGPVSEETTIHTPTRAVLREGERQVRERERLAVALPPLDAHVTLEIQRASLPNVIHPLTQEVLLVLELYSRVGDVVDHCSYPDYQVLRTLRTLLDRGMIRLRREPEAPKGVATGGLFSAAKAARLRDWLDGVMSRSAERRDVKLPIVACDGQALHDFAELLSPLPGVEFDSRLFARDLSPDTLVPFGRLTLEADVGIELIQLPASERFAPMWPVAAHGSIAILLLLAGPMSEAVAVTRRANEVIRALPRARVFHALLLEQGESAAPEMLREHLELLDENSLFLIPKDNPDKARVLLREMFARVLP